MAVRIRLKKLGRKHRPYFRVCAMDARSPRGGKVLEELGTYDPMLRDTDARAVLNAERINHWLSVGALPTEKVAVLIKKYGENGTHAEAQRVALEKLGARSQYAAAAPALIKPEQPAPPAPAEPAPSAEAPAEAAPAEAPAAEAPAAEAAPSTEAPAEAAPSEETPAAEAAPSEETAAADQPAEGEPAKNE